MVISSQILGFITATLVGVCLGLTGGGGSILTIPALVYLLRIEPLLATSYSLFIVGFSSLAGSLGNMYRGFINYKAAILYAIPSMIAVFVTRKFLLPLIPDPIVLNRIVLDKGETIMTLLAFIMLIAAFSMIRTGKADLDESETSHSVFNFPLIVTEGLIVGAITGILGAGGGFLIIPVLVVVSHIPMKIAIGTSLLIISVNSLVGFYGDLGAHTFDWEFLFTFTFFTILGVAAGSIVGRKISGRKLKKIFGWFVMIMAGFILYREVLVK